MRLYLAIDPGASPGWAVLDGDANLDMIACGAGEPPGFALDMGKVYDVVLIERPTIYPYSEASPANIITLAITAGKFAGILEKSGSVVKWVEPRTWKGQIKKPVHHPRIKKAARPRERLIIAEAERGMGKEREDMMDAVGLAQYGRSFHVFA